jgi:hypothetical protein
MAFDFNLWAKFHNRRLNRRVHIAVSLMDLRDSQGVSASEREVLAYAVEYIKALELEVSRLEHAPTPRRQHVQD